MSHFLALTLLALLSAQPRTQPRLHFEQGAAGTLTATRLLPEAILTAHEVRAPGPAPALRFEGIARGACLQLEEPLPGLTHDLAAASPSSRRHHARARVRDAWPGIDIVHLDRGGRLEHDFVVAPGADPSRIRLAFPRGARLALAADGSLVASNARGSLTLHAPVAWQDGAAGREPVACAFEVSGRRASFAVGARDPARELIIDPALSWSTYAGGANDSFVDDVLIESDGSVLVLLSAKDMPSTPGGLPPEDVQHFIPAVLARLDADGGGVQWISNLPAMGLRDLLRLPSGDIIVAGSCNANGYPVIGGRPNAGGNDFYLQRIAADGSSVVASTFLGGNGFEGSGKGLCRQSDGTLVVVGLTESADLVATTAIGPGGGRQDAIIARISEDLATVLSIARIGGPGNDQALAAAVLATDDSLAVSFDVGPGFPVVNAFQPAPPANAAGCDASDVAVARLSAGASQVLFATYLAGSCEDHPAGVTIDAASEIVVLGATNSADFPILDAWQPALAGGTDMFVTRISATGTLVASTYFGGSADDAAFFCTIDPQARLVVAGNSKSPDFPRLDDFGLPSDVPNDQHVHVTVSRFDIDNGPELSTTFGGTVRLSGATNSVLSYPMGISADATRLVVGGFTLAADFPTTAGAVWPAPTVDPANIFARMSGFVTDIGGTISMLTEVSPVGPGRQPFRVRNGGPGLVLGWDETHGGLHDAGAHFVIYQGTLDSLSIGRYDHVPVLPCSFSTSPAQVGMPPGDAYFLVARAKEDEGSLGVDSFGRARPRSRTPCP